MKTIIMSLALGISLALGNISSSFSQNKTQVYSNIIEDKDNNTVTTSIYEGKNNAISNPIKQYTIKYNEAMQPVEKINYIWNSKKRVWQVSEKYTYTYTSTGGLESLTRAEWNSRANTWNDDIEYSIYLLNIDQNLLSAN